MSDPKITPDADAGGPGRRGRGLWSGLIAPYVRLPAAVRVEIVIVGIVALGAGVLSWDALRWGAGELGIDPALTWIYPVVIDGSITGATVGLLALRRDAWYRRGYMWLLLGAGLGGSVVGNAAHSSGGPELIGALTLHRLGSAVPALGLAAMLHTLVLIVRRSGAAHSAPVRASRQARTRTGARTVRARRAPAARVALPDGRQVSPGHARKLAARQRRALGALDAA